MNRETSSRGLASQLFVGIVPALVTAMVTSLISTNFSLGKLTERLDGLDALSERSEPSLGDETFADAADLAEIPEVDHREGDGTDLTGAEAPRLEVESCDHGKTYLARSDGFVIARSGGSNVLGAKLFSAPESSQLGETESVGVMTRFGCYDGALLPVQRGWYWKVIPEACDGNGGSESSIEVQWLGVGRETCKL